MLAQSQSSSAKKGELAADVISGLIFIKKKKKHWFGRMHTVKNMIRPLKVTNQGHKYK